MLGGKGLSRIWRRFRVAIPTDSNCEIPRRLSEPFLCTRARTRDPIWRRREHSAKSLRKPRRKTISPGLASRQKEPAGRPAKNPYSRDRKEPAQNPLRMTHQYSHHKIGPAHWQARDNGLKFSGRPEGGAQSPEPA